MSRESLPLTADQSPNPNTRRDIELADSWLSLATARCMERADLGDPNDKWYGLYGTLSIAVAGSAGRGLFVDNIPEDMRNEFGQNVLTRLAALGEQLPPSPDEAGNVLDEQLKWLLEIEDNPTAVFLEQFANGPQTSEGVEPTVI